MKEHSHNVIKQLACLVVAHIRMHASTAQETFLGQMGEASGGIAYILQMAEQGRTERDRALILNPVRPPFASSQREYGQIRIFGSAPRIGIDFSRLFSGPTGFNTAKSNLCNVMPRGTQRI